MADDGARRRNRIRGRPPRLTAGEAARASGLQPASRDIRFVPVDFARDRLEDALASAGHDASRPTTWIWEGVIMYLERADIESTLRVIEARSARASCLTVVYHIPSLWLRPFGFFFRRIGEPLRSAFTTEQMRVLLGTHGFTVTQDDNLPTIARRLSAELGNATRFVRHMRIAIAESTPAR